MKNGIREAKFSCQVCWWWTRQMGMQLFPSLRYWSCGCDQRSNVLGSVKPSRSDLGEQWWFKARVKARALLGRTFGRSVAMAVLELVTPRPHRTTSCSVVPAPCLAILSGTLFSICWAMSLRNQYMACKPQWQCSLLTRTVLCWAWEVCSACWDVFCVICPSLR